MVMTTHELTTNDYLLMHLAVRFPHHLFIIYDRSCWPTLLFICSCRLISLAKPMRGSCSHYGTPHSWHIPSHSTGCNTCASTWNSTHHTLCNLQCCHEIIVWNKEPRVTSEECKCQLTACMPYPIGPLIHVSLLRLVCPAPRSLGGHG